MYQQLFFSAKHFRLRIYKNAICKFYIVTLCGGSNFPDIVNIAVRELKAKKAKKQKGKKRADFDNSSLVHYQINLLINYANTAPYKNSYKSTNSFAKLALFQRQKLR